MRIAVTLGRRGTPRQHAKQRDYVQALLDAGARPDEIVEIRPGDVLQGSFDGLLLSGGTDVAPERYGQERLPNASLDVDEERDDTEFPLLAGALRDGAPVLGVCRGLQVVNVGLGGTLIQDLPSQNPSEIPHDDAGDDRANRIHPVQVDPDTRLGRIAGVSEIGVNSRHHQAIDRPAAPLVVSAKAPDGTIEAVESVEGPWLVAVQWHPENLRDDEVTRRLFREFVEVAREKSGAGARSDVR
ncbi:MAG TPA: gamma-glutamyl-gamma-aminobutyrate hydrolase family protein [Thermoanaerobaculia bacterium]|nr:gamma-glutamyl-gamma-aminobutyrate hydrolase family protein [Thermoanaerobaculia bacterium]